MGQKWRGYGQKVNLLRQELESHKHKRDLIVLFSDANDVLFTTGAEEIIKKFKTFDAKVLFSADAVCAPNESLSSQ